MRHHGQLVRPFELKGLDDQGRTFEGLLSTFEQDLGGDVVERGAFKRTLADWKKAKNKVIPLIDSHGRSSVRAVVGKLEDAEEQDAGLWTKWSVLDAGDPDADAVHRRVKGGYVSKLSMGYRTIQQRNPTDEERKRGVFRYLKEVALEEGSVVIFPMNPGAEVDLTTVKSLLALAAEDEIGTEDLDELKALHQQIGALLSRPASEGDPSAPDAGLAQDHPKRLELESIYREIILRGLAH